MLQRDSASVSAPRVLGIKRRFTATFLANSHLGYVASTCTIAATTRSFHAHAAFKATGGATSAGRVAAAIPSLIKSIKLIPVGVMVRSARVLSWPCVEGTRREVQFRAPQAICELYWHEPESAPHRTGEPWAQYIDRSADEVLEGVCKLPLEIDLASDGIRAFEALRALHSSGENLVVALGMVLHVKRPLA